VALVHLDTTGQSERVVDAIRATAADTEGRHRRHDGGRCYDPPRARSTRLEAQRCLRGSAGGTCVSILKPGGRTLLGRDPDEMEKGEESATADAESLRCRPDVMAITKRRFRRYPITAYPCNRLIVACETL
jgi:hypothetical protein